MMPYHCQPKPFSLKEVAQEFICKNLEITASNSTMRDRVEANTERTSLKSWITKRIKSEPKLQVPQMDIKIEKREDAKIKIEKREDAKIKIEKREDGNTSSRWGHDGYKNSPYEDVSSHKKKKRKKSKKSREISELSRWGHDGYENIYGKEPKGRDRSPSPKRENKKSKRKHWSKKKDKTPSLSDDESKSLSHSATYCKDVHESKEGIEKLKTTGTQTDNLDNVLRRMIIQTANIPPELIEDYMNTMTFASMSPNGLLDLPLGRHFWLHKNIENDDNNNAALKESSDFRGQLNTKSSLEPTQPRQGSNELRAVEHSDLSVVIPADNTNEAVVRQIQQTPASDNVAQTPSTDNPKAVELDENAAVDKCNDTTNVLNETFHNDISLREEGECSYSEDNKTPDKSDGEEIASPSQQSRSNHEAKDNSTAALPVKRPGSPHTSNNPSKRSKKDKCGLVNQDTTSHQLLKLSIPSREDYDRMIVIDDDEANPST